MALQASGEIKISEIITELGYVGGGDHKFAFGQTGAYGTINTANPAANRPDQSQPHKMSEWYSYNHSLSANVKYWNFADTQGLGFSASSARSTGNDFSVSFWINPKWANSDTNVMLFMATNSTTATSNRLFFMYDYGLNRFIARFRSNAVNSRGTHWNLNSNSAQTGITSGKWHGTQKGNVNSDDMVHIVLTFDISQTSGMAAFEMYWNGVRMPNKLTSLTSSFFHFNMDNIYINRSNNGTGNSRASEYDNYTFFDNKLLSQTEITNIYNSGTSLPAASPSIGEDDNVYLAFDAETDPPTAVDGDDFSITWSNIVDQGSAVSY